MQSTFTFKQSTIVGIRQPSPASDKPDFGTSWNSVSAKIWKFLSKSSDFRPPSPNFGGTVSDFDQTSRNLGRMAEYRPFGMILPDMAVLCQILTNLAISGCSGLLHWNLTQMGRFRPLLPKFGRPRFRTLQI